MDGGPAIDADALYDLYARPPGPLDREHITEPLVTGVRAIDSLLPFGKGQRVGIFGGSGVGKSTLLGAMARHNSADVSVIALIGERNREVREFIEKELSAEGLRRSVVVAATSDMPAPLRIRAGFVALAVAEYFRDQGKSVLLVMDSITRLAMAQREIGLAAGEPPSQKGYTPSVFDLLPKLFERAGNFKKGSITGFFTVLVEGDDFNEPICDATRAILDGHIILSRQLGSMGHYPAIDILNSISRLANRIATPKQREAARKIREALSAYQQSEDLINLGAYASGANATLDAAIRVRPKLLDFLRQTPEEATPVAVTTAARMLELAGTHVRCEIPRSTARPPIFQRGRAGRTRGSKPPHFAHRAGARMKRFAFPLERVLSWRRMQARVERLRWERIRTELRAIEERARAAARGTPTRLGGGSAVAKSTTGAELAALDRFRRHVDAERARLERKRAECEKRLAGANAGHDRRKNAT